MKTNIITNQATGQKICKCFKRCGGCQLEKTYEEQLKWKQEKINRMLSGFCHPAQIIPMDNPYNYRNKAQAMFRLNGNKQLISGVYQSGNGTIVATDDCMLEDKQSSSIIAYVRDLMKQFKIMPFDFESGRGLLRHILVRKSFSTGEIMVCLVTSGPIFPAKRNFVTALRSKYPEVATVVQNICTNPMPLTLGDRENILFGRGYIEDEVCKKRFRVSAKSFSQVNPVQTEKLYNTAVEFAQLTGNEVVLDAYCGTGTIGIISSDKAKRVVGVEINKAAVYDAVGNAKLNKCKNVDFYCADSGRFMEQIASENEGVNVVFMDPPRAGADEKFLESLAVLSPKRVVYVSCNPETLVRDLRILKKHGYKVEKIQPVDMFPHTTHVECVCLLTRMQG